MSRRDFVAIGARIRARRQERGLTVADVAGADVSRAFLEQVESGRAAPSAQTLQLIANRLRVPVADLLANRHRFIVCV